MKPALMIIDMQKAYFEDTSKPSMVRAADYINEVLGYFRTKKLPVVWVQDIDEEGGVVPGTEGFEIIELLQRQDEELLIYKKYGNSFNKTELNQRLQELGCDVLIMSGYCAEHCVLSTYRGALDLEYTPVLLRHGVASGSPENLAFVEKLSELATYKVVKMLVESV